MYLHYYQVICNLSFIVVNNLKIIIQNGSILLYLKLHCFCLFEDIASLFMCHRRMFFNENKF